MFKKMKIGVGIVAYNEESSIGRVIRDFRSLGIVDKIIVVDNNSTDKTAQIAKKLRVKIFTETNQGYGYACRRALKECPGDIIVLVEGDASFEARDLYKFLSYIEDVDMVLGTRTTRELISKNAKMGRFLLWGNLFLAKLIQLRFWGRIRLTDVGCTFRIIKRSALKKILKKLNIGGSTFSPGMIIESLKSKIRIVEIPINYNERLGQSKITSTKFKSLKLGLRMLRLILTP